MDRQNLGKTGIGRSNVKDANFKGEILDVTAYNDLSLGMTVTEGTAKCM